MTTSLVEHLSPLVLALPIVTEWIPIRSQHTHWNANKPPYTPATKTLGSRNTTGSRTQTMISITSSSFRALWNGIHQDTLCMYILHEHSGLHHSSCTVAKTNNKYRSNNVRFASKLKTVKTTLEVRKKSGAARRQAWRVRHEAWSAA